MVYLGLNLGLAQVCTKAKVGSSVLKTGPDRPVQLVTFPVRFPFLSRLSIGPVLNRLGQRFEPLGSGSFGEPNGSTPQPLFD